jgi:hypothetical protein
MHMPELRCTEQTMMQQVGNYAGDNPEMFNAGIRCDY